MMVRSLFAVSNHGTALSVGLGILRVVAGLAFIHHGWGKIQTPFSWMGADSPVPGFLQFLAAFSEFGGGLAWILGLLTPLASFGILCTMVVAVYFHAVLRGDPFVAAGPGAAYELAAIYLCVAVVLITSGPGRWSLDRKIFGLR